MAGPQITAEVSGRVPGRPERVHELFREIDLTTILTGLGPLPAVESVTSDHASWSEVGFSRTLHLADGSRLRERMTKVDPPKCFTYEIDQITSPLRHLVSGMRGHWSFEVAEPGASPGDTIVRWHYAFDTRSWLTSPLSFLIIKLVWRAYMGQVLARAAAQAA